MIKSKNIKSKRIYKKKNSRTKKKIKYNQNGGLLTILYQAAKTNTDFIKNTLCKDCRDCYTNYILQPYIWYYKNREDKPDFPKFLKLSEDLVNLNDSTIEKCGQCRDKIKETFNMSNINPYRKTMGKLDFDPKILKQLNDFRDTTIAENIPNFKKSNKYQQEKKINKVSEQQKDSNKLYNIQPKDKKGFNENIDTMNIDEVNKELEKYKDYGPGQQQEQLGISENIRKLNKRKEELENKKGGNRRTKRKIRNKKRKHSKKKIKKKLSKKQINNILNKLNKTKKINENYYIEKHTNALPYKYYNTKSS
jgi:vacuolar-type H+-ATPase subunit I/STV1